MGRSHPLHLTSPISPLEGYSALLSGHPLGLPKLPLHPPTILPIVLSRRAEKLLSRVPQATYPREERQQPTEHLGNLYLP